MLKDSKAFGSFSTDSIEEAHQFYGQTLGLETDLNEMNILTLHFAGGAQAIVYPRPDHHAADFTVLNFLVEDIDEAVDELTAKGLEFEHYGGDGPVKTDEKGIARGGGDNPGPSIAWFKDPAGNILSIIEE